ncbi:MAG: S8 family serine peptidase [Bacillaceae bacterium]|nr:S8 family serine peptidase [Bacillaceae bacterium]
MLLSIFLVVVLVYIFNLDNLGSVNNTITTTNISEKNDSKIYNFEGQVVPWGLEVLGVRPSDYPETTNKVKVAIIDSGIYKDHEDLYGKVVKEFNAINPNEPITDDFGHGTAVAGIITANNNDIGIVGVTQKIDIYSVKVISNDGKVNKDAFVRGLEWAISEQVDIINVSLGFQNDNQKIRNLIDSAVSQGIIIVASSGNTYGLNAEYPARYPNVISVGIIDMEMKSTSLNAKGKIDFVAPGIKVLSTSNDGAYSLFDGASFSTAYVTGIVSRVLNEKDWEVSSERFTKVYEYLENISLSKGNEQIYGNGIPRYEE